jgi:glycosyltransferase involved in cell wall biosynthesis
VSEEAVAPLRSIAVVASYVPRRCGIATFTADLVDGVRRRLPQTRVLVVAVNDRKEGYEYPDEVAFEVDEKQLQDYRAAADFLNSRRVDAVSVQHEYGIYGGADGGHVLELIGRLRAPVVVTLHTVLARPSPAQRAVVREFGVRADRLVVMSDTARRFLVESYGVDESKVRFAPHGIPDVPFVDPNYYKDQFGVEGRKVLLTFGLLSRNKGIEHMIGALPAVARRHDDVVYLVLGATHPHARRVEGEAYRTSLKQLARRLGVLDRVHFHDRFVELQELVEFLGCADLYVTPYLNEEQIVSGTLAYAMGAGKAIVSTPYWYARDLLDDDRGVLVPSRDSGALAKAVGDLLDDETARHAMRKRAYQYTRGQVWSEVARRYVEIFEEARSQQSHQPRPPRRLTRERFESLPEVDLSHLVRLTDDTGILQHARHQVPNRHHGYCTDDVARALLVVAQALPFVTTSGELDRLAVGYVAFLVHAFDETTGCFRNVLTYDRRFPEECGSSDSQGRAVQALATAAALLPDRRLRAVTSDLLHASLARIEPCTDLRAIASAMLGLGVHLETYPGDSVVKRTRQTLAERLLAAFESAREDASWPWPEPVLTYSNALLPHALVEGGRQLENLAMSERGLQALRWLMEVQTEDGHFAPVGNQGWFQRGGARARFDQQPIDAHASVAACAAAFRATGDETWLERARLAFRWFLGDNDAGTPLYDHATGGCHDGLRADGVNENQGAESTLAWLSSLLTMHTLESAGLLEGRIAAAKSAAVP